jgi:uncharacterized membrane protein YphA (DoxX/SURF4 family)
MATTFVLAILARKHFRERKQLAKQLTFPFWPFGGISVWLLILVEMIICLSLFLGLFTQIGAGLLILLCGKLWFLSPSRPHSALPSRSLVLLLGAIGLSLFITGAGAFAFDLPI